MTGEPHEKSDQGKRAGWLRHARDDASGHRRGDTIVAEIGESASHVAVGKNILQIGTLRVPFWLAAVITTSSVIGAVAVVIYVVFTGRFVGETKAAVDIALAPTPIPTATPTATPSPQTGDINIAIAKPVLMTPVDDPQIADFLNWYPEELNSHLEQDFKKYRTSLELEPDIRIIPVTITNVDARDQIFADYARKIRADVLLYGVLDTESNPAHFLPEFYINPEVVVGTQEITGFDAFGDPIDVRFSENGIDSLTWKVDLNAPIADLSAFVSGVSFFHAGEYKLALELFEKLNSSSQWATSEGKAILYLWLGTTHHFRALQQKERGLEPQRVRCLVTGEEVLESECAKLSYEHAIELKRDYPRAYIGLGNYWLEAEDLYGCERFGPALENYRSAKDNIEIATGQESQFLETSLASMKVLYQLGLTHARALQEGCDDIPTHDAASIAYLTQALESYYQAERESGEANSTYRDLASRSSYMLGQVHQALGRDIQALDFYSQTIGIATLPGGDDDPWPSIRWVAENQIGAIYLAQVETNNYDSFEPAYDALYAVTKAYEDDQFGDTYDDLPVAASAAYYHLGRLYNALAQRDRPAIDSSALVEAETSLNRSLDVLTTLDSGVRARQSDSLQWRNTLELGHVDRLWGDSGSSFRYDDALKKYQSVLDAVDNGEIVDGQVALDLLSEAAYGAGAVYKAQGNNKKAVEYLNLAIDAGNSRPVFVESVKQLLEDVSD